MRWFPVIAAIVAVAAYSSAPVDLPGLTLKRTIPLPGMSGRIDHLAFDPDTGRLFIAALANGSLEVVDLEKGERIKSIGGLDEPQGVTYVPATKQVVVACGGDGTVRAIDSVTLEERVKVKVGDDADNVRLGVDEKSIVVGYGDGALAVLDADKLRTLAAVKLPGHPESFQIDGANGRALVNVPGGLIGGGGAVVVADLSRHAIIATWELKEAGRNFPMALDAPNKRLYVGCRRSAKLLVLDTDSGRIVASPDCVGDADDVFIDPKTGRVFVIGGDGEVDVFETPDRMIYTKARVAKTVSGARTGLLVAERRVLLVAVPKRGGAGAEIREYALPD